jgi:hypothetical protein
MWLYSNVLSHEVKSSGFFLSFLLLSFIQGNKLFFIAHGRLASLMQRRCLRFFKKIAFGFFQSRLWRDRTAGGA